MAQIKNKKKYPLITPKDKDFLVATQESTGKTRSISVGDLSQHIVDKIPNTGGDAPIKDIKFKGESLPVVDKSVEIPSKLSEFDNDLEIKTQESVENIKTIADLRLREGKEEGEVIRLLGYYEAGDKPELLYKWVSGEVEDDGGSVIKVGKGYWSALFSTVVRVSDFGSLKNNKISNYFIKSKLNNINIDLDCDIVLEEDEELILGDNCVIFSSNNSKIIKEKIFTKTVLKIEGKNIQIKYLHIEANSTSRGYSPVNVNEGNNIQICNNIIQNTYRGVFINPKNNQKVTNINIENNLIQDVVDGVVIGGSNEDYISNITIVNNKILDGRGKDETDGGDGIKTNKKCKDIIIEGNIIKSFVRDGIDLFASGDKVIIVNNLIEGNKVKGIDIKHNEDRYPEDINGRTGRNIIIDNNYFYSNYVGIMVAIDSGNNASYNYDISINNNIFIENKTNAIHISGRYIKINSNSFYFNGKESNSTNYGAILLGVSSSSSKNCKNSSIQSNMFCNNGKNGLNNYGVIINQGSNYNNVSNNIFIKDDKVSNYVDTKDIYVNSGNNKIKNNTYSGSNTINVVGSNKSDTLNNIVAIDTKEQDTFITYIESKSTLDNSFIHFKNSITKDDTNYITINIVRDRGGDVKTLFSISSKTSNINKGINDMSRVGSDFGVEENDTLYYKVFKKGDIQPNNIIGTLKIF